MRELKKSVTDFIPTKSALAVGTFSFLSSLACDGSLFGVSVVVAFAVVAEGVAVVVVVGTCGFLT